MTHPFVPSGRGELVVFILLNLLFKILNFALRKIRKQIHYYKTHITYKNMKKHLAILTLFIVLTVIQAKSQNPLQYTRDTVWLKSGLAMPCKIITDSSAVNFIYVQFTRSNGDIEQSRFEWKLIKAIHKGSKPYLARSATYKVELLDGTVFTGKLTAETDTAIELQLKNLGKLTVRHDKIKKIIPLAAPHSVKKSFWFKNPHASRLLFAPTAIPLSKGEAYYQNIYVVGNMFNYGINNNLSVGGGFDFITMFGNFGDGWHPMLHFNIKSGFKVAENFYAGAGSIVIKIPYENWAGIIYGMGTYGNYNNNITTGLGWGFVDGSFEKKPFIMIGGMVRVSEKLWLISENWIAPVSDYGYYTVVSYGMRFAAKRIAVDLAFINSKDIFNEIFIGIPFVDFVVKLGKK